MCTQKRVSTGVRIWVPEGKASGLPCLDGCDSSNSLWSGMGLVIALNQASFWQPSLARPPGSKDCPQCLEMAVLQRRAYHETGADAITLIALAYARRGCVHGPSARGGKAPCVPMSQQMRANAWGWSAALPLTRISQENRPFGAPGCSCLPSPFGSNGNSWPGAVRCGVVGYPRQFALRETAC